jgi:hypothetical protein
VGTLVVSSVELVAEVARAVGGNRDRLHARGLLQHQHGMTGLLRFLREHAAREHNGDGHSSDAQHRQFLVT